MYFLLQCISFDVFPCPHTNMLLYYKTHSYCVKLKCQEQAPIYFIEGLAPCLYVSGPDAFLWKLYAAIS